MNDINIVHSRVPANVVRIVLVGEDAQCAPIPVGQQRKEHQPKKLGGDRGIGDRVGSVGLVDVVSVELGIDALDAGYVVRIGGSRDCAPPVIGD